jgi:hypothetical protein
LIALKEESDSFMLEARGLFQFLYSLWQRLLRMAGWMRKEREVSTCHCFTSLRSPQLRFYLHKDDRYKQFLGFRYAIRTMEDLKKPITVFNRFVMALFGGVALLGLTIIMTLHLSRNICLITTSVAFGASDSTGKDVFAATAAYVAVLVVFVGTSLSRA